MIKRMISRESSKSVQGDDTTLMNPGMTNRVVLTTQNNDPLLDLLLGSVQTIKVQNDVFRLLSVDPVVLLVIRWACSSIKLTQSVPIETHSTQKHPGTPNLSHDIVLESSCIKERCTTTNTSKGRFKLPGIRTNGDRFSHRGPGPRHMRVGSDQFLLTVGE